MTSEKPPAGDIPREVPQREAPTSLHLFGRSPLERENIIMRFNQASHLPTSFFLRKASRDRFTQATTDRIQRIDEERLENGAEIILCGYSIDIGRHYERMHKRLSVLGFSDLQVFSVFEAVLTVKRRLEELGIDTTESVLKDRVNQQRRKPSRIAGVLEQTITGAPDWFTGTKDEWKNLVGLHIALATSPPLTDTNKRTFGPIRIDQALPDWYTEADKKPPTIEDAVKELDNDSETIKILDQIRDALFRKRSNLNSQLQDMGIKSAAFFEKQRRHLLASIETFGDLVIFLGATKDIPAYKISPDQLLQLPRNTSYLTHAIPFTSAQKETIESFTNSQKLPFGKHAVALWIESKLREGGIIPNAQAPVDENRQSFISLLFPETSEPTQLSRFGELPEKNKKAFNALNYELAPLTNLLSEDQRSYMQELIEAYKGDSIEAFIWDMADLISTRLINTPDTSTLPNQTATTLRRLREFTGKWLKNNWEWAYQEITELPTQEERVEIVQEKDTPHLPEEVTVTEPEMSTVDREINQQIEETEEAITEIKRGNLGRYKLFYKFDRDDPLDRALPIEGESLGDFSDALASIIGKNGISCSEKPSSIINALDHLFDVPPIDRERLTKIILNGKVYYRVKRGGIRIFYDLHEDDGIFVMNIYQKKAQEYKR